MDARVFRASPDAFATDDAGPLLQGAAMMPVRVRETRFCDYVSDEDVAQIEDARLDVLLRFGFRILKGPILQAAKFGVWSYHHGDNQVNRGGPAGFWEVMTEQPTTGSVLQVLNEDLDNGRVIYQSHAGTDRSSVTRNRHNYFWKSAAFVTRKLRDVAESGAAALEGNACAGGCRDFRFYSQRLFRKPGNLETLSLVGRYVARRAKEHVRRLHEVDQWGLAWSLSKTAAPSTTIYRFTEEWPALGWSWADPFPVEAEHGYDVFLEVYDHATRRGSIGVSRLSRDGVFEPPVTVLDAPYHLSYPFVFQWRGQWFLMPESFDVVTNRGVRGTPLSVRLDARIGAVQSGSRRRFDAGRSGRAMVALHQPDAAPGAVQLRRALRLFRPDSTRSVDAASAKSRQVGCALGAGRGPVPLERREAVPALAGCEPAIWLRDRHQPNRRADAGSLSGDRRQPHRTGLASGPLGRPYAEHLSGPDDGRLPPRPREVRARRRDSSTGSQLHSSWLNGTMRRSAPRPAPGSGTVFA